MQRTRQPSVQSLSRCCRTTIITHTLCSPVDRHADVCSPVDRHADVWPPQLGLHAKASLRHILAAWSGGGALTPRDDKPRTRATLHE